MADRDHLPSARFRGLADPDPRDVTAASGGDPAALDRLLRRVTPLVIRYARYRAADAADSPEDLAQDVCAALIGALPRYVDHGRPFMSFVYRIAANRVIDLRRERARTPVSIDHATLDDAIGPIAPSPEVLIEEPDGAAALQAALARLPDHSRLVVVLRVGYGVPAEVVARLTATAPATVRVTQHRALAALRNTIANAAPATVHVERSAPARPQ